jgi:glycosyltransferase involved in cell wall biosynthesis
VADTSSLPEVVGAAALRLPPRDAGAWADAIARLWDDDDARAELARRGPEQAARFSWSRAAGETLQIYRRVMRAAGRGGA